MNHLKILTSPESHLMMAQTFHKQKMLSQAQYHCEKVIQLYQRELNNSPSHACFTTYVNLGYAYQALNQLSEAFHYWQLAIQLEPNHDLVCELYYLMGWCTYQQKHLFQTIQYLEKSIQSNPSFYDSYSFLIYLLHFIGQPNPTLLQKALEQWPLDLPCVHYCFQYFLAEPCITPSELFEAHYQYSQSVLRKISDTFASYLNVPDPNKKIRLGYLSSDFWNQSSMFFLKAFFLQRDQKQFEIY